jgi:DNA-binding winged helix-turn-helix (wHTH) protein/pimeloyl-ACP methyl ester carboxylesterase
VQFVFGDAELDLTRYELRRNGVVVPLEPQAFDVLTYLVRHREHVVAKEELMDEIWGGRFVSETAVTSRIKQVRRAVGDDGQAQQVIRTVHGRGYRFVADVTERPEAAEQHDPTESAASVAYEAPVPEMPVQYVLADGLNIAYQVTGNGGPDIVLIPGFISHLELDWAEPRHAHFLRRLSSWGRLVRFDKRGTGMSDRPGGLPDLEARMHDVLAVMDAADSARAIIFGYSEGAPMAALFAAAHPERVMALVLYGGYAKRLASPDYPWAPTAAERARYAERLAHEWSWEADMRAMCPSADDAMARWWGRRARAAATPATVRALVEMNSQVDVRDVLGAIHAPTLVLHRRGDRDSRPEEGRYLAEHIPGARFVELSGADHFVGVDPDQILDEMAPFVAELGAGAEPARSLVALVALSGSSSDRIAQRAADHGGRLRKTSGGQSLVSFDGPATAIRSMLAVGFEGHGVGVHITELPRSADPVNGDGIQATLALAARARPGEIWTSATVRELLSGSGIAVESSGWIQGRAEQSPAFRVVP